MTVTMTAADMLTGKPVVVGVMTDIQYADKPDQTMEQMYGPSVKDTMSVDISSMRYYSKCLPKADKAVSHMNAADVCATLHLGDIVDGNSTQEATRAELAQVLGRLKGLQSPVLHVLGNHCLAVGRSYLLSELGLPSEVAYYVRDVSDSWQIVVLDTVDLSVLRDPCDPAYKQAEQYLKAHEGRRNAQSWNGTIGHVQKKWLVETLRRARIEGKKMIVCGHHPIFMEERHGPVPFHVMWDNESVADILEEFKDVVKAYFAGHFHQGGYTKRSGIHYVVFESILDSKHSDGSFATVKLYDNAIVIDGHGDMTSRTLSL